MKSLIAKLLLVLGGGGLAAVVDAFLAASRLGVDQTGGWWLQVLTFLVGGGGAVTTGALLSRGAAAPASDTKAAFAALVKELAGHPQKEQLLTPLRDALIADAVEDFKRANEFPDINPPAPKIVITPVPVPQPAPVVAEVPDAPKA